MERQRHTFKKGKFTSRSSVKKTRPISIAISVAALFFFVLATVGMFVLHSFLSISGKASVVFPQKTGDVAISVFDFDTKEITNIIIPASTEIVASRHLGIWKLGSLWQLGKDEGLEGKLLKESVVKNFHFPVLFWADGGSLGILGCKEENVEGCIVSSKKSDIPLKYKVAMALLSARCKGLNRTDIDLSNTSFLVAKNTAAGENGYSITAFVPDTLVAKFAMPEGSSGLVKVAILDETDEVKITENVGETVEMLGAKVVSVNRRDDSTSSDCEISGKLEAFTATIARVFDCKITHTGTKENADMTIILGNGFGRRF